MGDEKTMAEEFFDSWIDRPRNAMALAYILHNTYGVEDVSEEIDPEILTRCFDDLLDEGVRVMVGRIMMEKEMEASE